ncbi:hypothetical protein L613_006400000110 [Pseudoxanthomonas taiwanensis J19]|uniref:Uncharacterized protein n=1 Tax=Pseudoxanthomonas taiwanensis J19 TaxID=935569 RepID=A0A562D5P9_9GAMM|nr:hypothetical protein L613_006400000110 [Pseudoxanthomonas taiwanensis J19]
MVCTLAVSSAPRAGRVTPPGTITPGRSPQPARASIIAGRPLSQVAMPSTPRRVGSERTRRRMVIAASLRYGRLSNMPVVPWVRPSHGSEHITENGRPPLAANVSAAARTRRSISQWPVCRPSATGWPSPARRPPWVLTIRYGSRAISLARQPMPAFWVMPNRCPLGAWRSIVSSIGRRPGGPSPEVRVSARAVPSPRITPRASACIVHLMRRRWSTCRPPGATGCRWDWHRAAPAAAGAGARCRSCATRRSAAARPGCRPR